MNLNKLGSAELGMHKQAMEVDYTKNAVRPGDPGFEYDKRIDFSKKTAAANEADSWDEDDDKDYSENYSEYE
jgi:hypothetical protein